MDEYYAGVCPESLAHAWNDVSSVLEGRSQDRIIYRRKTGGTISCDTPEYSLVRAIVVGRMARQLAIAYGDIEEIPPELGNGMWGCIAVGLFAESALNQHFGSTVLESRHDRDGNGEHDPLELSLALGEFFLDECFDENTLSLIGFGDLPSTEYSWVTR